MTTSDLIVAKDINLYLEKPIPVVQYSLYKENPNQDVKFVDIDRVVKLLSNPHSATLYERHGLALKKLMKHSKNGFMMKDALNISRLLTICGERIALLPDIYLEWVIKMIKLLSIPSIKQKSSDKLLYHKIYVDLLSQIAYLLRLDNIEVKLQICKTLNDIYTNEPPACDIKDWMYNDLEYIKQVIEESDVSEILTQTLTTIGNNLEFKLAVLNLLQLISSSSETCCNKILSVNGAQNLYSLSNLDSSSNVLFRIVEILWNLMERGDSLMVNDQLDNKEFINWVRDSFINQLSKGYSTFDRQLRNDLLIIATMVAQINPNAPFVETGFVKQLTLLATFQEVKSHNPLVKNLKLALNHEDFELKKLLINILLVLSDNKAVIPFLEDGQFLLALFSSMMPPTDRQNSQIKQTTANESTEMAAARLFEPSPTIWRPAYQEELQLLALDCLAQLVPKMLSKFQDICGVSRLLLMVEWCINDQMGFAGNGNGFHSVWGRGNKLAQMRYTMRLILKVVRMNDDVINQEFISEGCIAMFSEILGNVIKWELCNTIIDLEIQCDMLFILAAICEHEPHSKELFGASGVSVLIGFMKICLMICQTTLQKKSGSNSALTISDFSNEMGRIDKSNLVPAEANGVQKLIIATIDCVWGCIIGCYFTEHMFLDQNGAFLILDMLEMLPKEFYPQILGCLVDLSENAKTLVHLSSWRGSILIPGGENRPLLVTNKKPEIQTNIAHLLCRIWRGEEDKLEVDRGEFGTLTELVNPLMSAEQRTSSPVGNLSSSQPSRAILEVGESLRANIYSLLSRLGYLDHPGLQIEDHVTLTIIESYLEFKMGEVWTEIQKELDLEEMRPVSPDIEALEWISRSIEQEGIRVSKVQQELLDATQVQDGLDEFEFYNQLRENHRQKEKNIQHFNDFVERTSKYDKLKLARQNQIINIDASRIALQKPDPRLVVHPVGVENIQVTKFCADTIQIDSTPVDILGGKIVALETFGHSYTTKQKASKKNPGSDKLVVVKSDFIKDK